MSFHTGGLSAHTFFSLCIENKYININQTPAHRLSNMKILFKTITACFPDLPHFDMASGSNAVATTEVGSTTTSSTTAAAAPTASGSSHSNDPGGYDGSINGRCTPSPEAVSSGTDRNATLELIWRIFLGNALKVMKLNVIDDETNANDIPKEPTAFLKEAYKVYII
jgi:hypothetical protein